MTGPQYLGLGLGLAVMGLIVLAMFSINGTAVSEGRPLTMVVIGIPAGVVLTVIGLVKIFRANG
ncbi:hypothetical protein [Rathayibacter sp. PhB151]|uniref:hypothetical protein n=1 Tax=Rathayibacter sp. PhB151 TaxID=2485189 RepID=UPI001062CC62|nr:hypothetical protein [Rathayibacter sp. PhB151]